MIQIRRMTPGDCPAVYEIEQACFTDPWRLEDFQTMLSYSYNIFFVAEEEGKLQGFSCISLSGDTGDIMNIAVRESCRGRGIGQALLLALLKQATGSGCLRLFLEVREGNLSARRLYERNGFRQIALRKLYYSNPPEDGIVMERITEDDRENSV